MNWPAPPSAACVCRMTRLALAPLLETLTRTETNFTSHGFAQGL